MEKEYFTVTDEEGKELVCEIILTFDSEEFNKSYVLYAFKDDESGEVMAASYDPKNDGEGKLEAIQTDAEWDLIEDVLEKFLDEEEENE